MRILIVGDYPLDVTTFNGGVPVVIFNLVKGLKKIKDLEVHVITCKKEVSRIFIRKDDNLIIHYLPEQRKLGNITLSILDSLKIRREIRKIDPDVIHSVEQAKYSYSISTLRYPAVMEVTVIAAEEAKYRKGIIGKIRAYSLKYMESACLKRAKNIIVISPYVNEQIKTRTNAKLFPRFNPINDAFFKLSNKEISCRILFAGRVMPRKGLHILFEALHKIKYEFPKVKLIIAGDIVVNDYYNTLQELIKKLHLEENIVFSGILNEDKLLDEYSQCSLLAMPSFYETFGNVAAQAMAAGKAVVASRVGGVSSYLINGETGFLTSPGDVGELAQRIMQLLADDKLRWRMGEKGREHAAHNFSIDVIAKRNLEIYEEVCNAY